MTETSKYPNTSNFWMGSKNKNNNMSYRFYGSCDQKAGKSGNPHSFPLEPVQNILCSSVFYGNLIKMYVIKLTQYKHHHISMYLCGIHLRLTPHHCSGLPKARMPYIAECEASSLRGISEIKSA